MENSSSNKRNISFIFFKSFIGVAYIFARFYYKEKNYIISFEKDPKHSKVYNDNLCLFRCLTYHETKSYGLAFEERVKTKF